MTKNILDYVVISICVFLIINAVQSRPPYFDFETKTKKYYIDRNVQYVCAKASDLRKDVLKNENKERIGWGLSSDNRFVEFYQGKKEKSFLIVFTFTNGLSCGLIGGKEFYFRDKLLKGE